MLGACCQVLPIFVCGRALARLSVSYVLWNVHGVIRVRDAVVIRALGQVSGRFLFFWGLFLVCVCVFSLSLFLSFGMSLGSLRLTVKTSDGITVSSQEKIHIVVQLWNFSDV